ncbi:GerMN domain-containing protein [Micromonospora sp. WMMD812]|uniref:GerMN domain-containing protein n=1 Tax=Micromonospora sp. WMMD812 TaxID=3015152 RepID=UPI00248B87D9|nr:GerMN domain-containing protein [Micromonospora sp. WMMD812]WBB68473.1 GerMN domain-containing protein [Micromonospora sp. WMMD812]
MRARFLPLALAVLLGGCGVPADEVPRPVRVPPGPFPVPVTVSPTTSEGRVDETLCFVRDDRMVRVLRRTDSLPSVDVHLQHLLAGPGAQERDDGLSSALTGTVTLAGARLDGGVAEVDVRAVGDETGRNDGVLAFGQIVCTLTARGDVDRVSFRRAGQPLDVPRADGSLTREPLTAADYAVLTLDR